jgi:hypothetical protein
MSSAVNWSLKSDKEAGRKRNQQKQFTTEAEIPGKLSQSCLVFDSQKSVPMPLTYFKRFRMELDLDRAPTLSVPLPSDYHLVEWDEYLIRDHAAAKYNSFRTEMDANVFPCLGRRDGCLKLMREIVNRSNFVPEATWLLRYMPAGRRSEPVGTVQGISIDGWGSLQNLGVARGHRGHGLGTILLAKAIQGFRVAGLSKMHLEVTSDNTAAVRLYTRLGFRNAQTVFKATDISAPV